MQKELSIGQISQRSGLPISTLHFYERKGLISSERNSANHRLYRRDVLRRIAIIKVAQSLGVTLASISQALTHLPKDATPSAEDWSLLSASWHEDLTNRINLLTSLRDKMDYCIGCGCLSMAKCPLFNDQDHLAEKGSGGPSSLGVDIIKVSTSNWQL